jgi:ADP-heptose:LPS heptosyltransferase
VKHLLVLFFKLFIRPGQPSPIHRAAPRSILVVRQHDQLGDMLCAVPLLRALRLKFPGAKIALLASPVNYEIMRNHPSADRVLLYDKKLFLRSPLALVRFFRELRSLRADLAVVPATVSMSFTSDLLAVLSGAGVRIGPGSLLGRPNPSRFCYTTQVTLEWKSESRRHQALRNLDIASGAGLHLETGDISSSIGLTAEERASATGFLSSLRKAHPSVIGFHPGAGKAENRWGAENFAAVAEHLEKKWNTGILLTAGPMDAEPLNVMRKNLRCPYEILQNYPIRQVAAIIDQLDLYLTNDTGVMHIAGATRAHLLALFGPTDPLEWAPIGEKNRFIGARDKKITSITVEEVINILEVMLNELQRNKRTD